MKRLGLLLAVAAMSAGHALAASPPRVRLWNLTPETLDEVRLAPAGTSDFGPNQCVNDRDGTVDFHEMLRITDVPPGVYDLRLRDVKGRVCFARKVSVPADGSFPVDEKDLVDCVP